MTHRGLILYGPPASGKDTITAELTRHDDRFVPLPKLKAGTGRTSGYRNVTGTELAELRAAGRLIAETRRYGNVYAVDRADIEAITAADRIPIAHMGNITDLQDLRAGTDVEWTAVLLWIPREICAERSQDRGDADTADRLRAWDETAEDLRAHRDNSPFSLVVHTDETAVPDTARLITKALRR